MLILFGVFDKLGCDLCGWIILWVFYVIVLLEVLEKCVVGDDVVDIGLFLMIEVLELLFVFDYLDMFKKVYSVIMEEFLLIIVICDFLLEIFLVELFY